MTPRSNYFCDLIDDCVSAAQSADVQPDERAFLIAALILADALNGVRKALVETKREGSK